MQKKILYQLQTLRFVAAAIVLFGHVLHEAQGLGMAANWLNQLPWTSGVDIFFVVSGFIMYHQSQTAFGKPGAPVAFMSRRLLRIVPLYWIFTSLMVLAILAGAGGVDHVAINPAHIVASYGFIPWPNDVGRAQPVLALGWTLNHEMFFYVAFAVALMFKPRAGLIALIAVLTGLALANPYIPTSMWMLRFWSKPIILEFLVGIGIAWLYARGLRLRPYQTAALVALGVIGLVGLWPAIGQKGVVQGASAVLISLGVMLSREGDGERNLLQRGVQLGGDASYSIYLSHPFFITAFSLVWKKLSLGWLAAYVVLGVVGAVVAGLVVYLVLERPLLAGLRRISRPKNRLSEVEVQAAP